MAARARPLERCLRRELPEKPLGMVDDESVECGVRSRRNEVENRSLERESIVAGLEVHFAPEEGLVRPTFARVFMAKEERLGTSRNHGPMSRRMEWTNSPTAHSVDASFPSPLPSAAVRHRTVSTRPNVPGAMCPPR